MSVQNRQIRILKTDGLKQIVFGEVYAPNRLDTHGMMMLAEDIETMAHRFLRDVVLTKSIDQMHDNKAVNAYPVESFIARKNDPDGYTEGAWVVGVKIEDPVIWDKVLKGDYNGFSIEVYVTKAAVAAEIMTTPHVFGETEAEADHSHLFFAEINEEGRVIGGMTSKAADGHFHVIKRASATEDAGDVAHSHRYFAV